MPDIVRDQQTTLPVTMLTRYKDMGDGTHAEVISVPGPFNVTVLGGNIIVQGVAGGAPFLTRVSNGVNVWYPYSEVILSTGTVSIQLPQPTRILPTADLKISAYASGAGAVSIAMRGWLEDV